MIKGNRLGRWRGETGVMKLSDIHAYLKGWRQRSFLLNFYIPV